MFIQVCDCFPSPADFGRIVREYGERLIAQRCMYAEIHFSPDPHQRRNGVTFHAMLEAINEARRNLQSRYGLELRWIADGVHNAAFGFASVDRTVDWMIQAGPTWGIVALGLGGEEHGMLSHVFRRVFARAGEAGFHITAHTGIITCPERIRQTISRAKGGPHRSRYEHQA